MTTRDAGYPKLELIYHQLSPRSYFSSGACASVHETFTNGQGGYSRPMPG